MTPKVYYICKSRDPKVIKATLEEIHHKAGTKAKAAKKMGISKFTLYAWYAKYGVDVPAEYPKTRPHTKGKRGPHVDWDRILERMGYERMKAMLRYCKNNYTYTKAADLLGVSMTTYRNALKDNGLI